MNMYKKSAYGRLIRKGLVDESQVNEYLLKREIERHINAKDLIDEQREVIKEYYSFMLSNGTKARKTRTHNGIIKTLHQFGAFIRKPFNIVDRQDIINYVASLKTSNKPNKESTITCKLATIKYFYKWLFGTNDYPEIVKWIKLRLIKTKISEDILLTQQEIAKMVSKCTDIRDKALIMMTYESGARIGEILGLKLKNIISDHYGMKIVVNGKTGMRQIRLVDSVPYVIDYINSHPNKDNSEAYLFFGFNNRWYGRSLKYQGAYYLFKKVAKRCKITKSVNPHMFRHARLNQLAKQGLNERDLRIFAGWSGNSPMPDVYLHYGEEVVDKKLLEMKGIVKREERQDNNEFKAKPCYNCKRNNPADAIYCKCGLLLDETTERIEKANQEMNELFADSEFRELLKAYLRSKKFH